MPVKLTLSKAGLEHAIVNQIATTKKARDLAVPRIARTTIQRVGVQPELTQSWNQLHGTSNVDTLASPLQRAPRLAVSDDRRGNLGQWEKASFIRKPHAVGVSGTGAW